jgi:hypothetical protein
MATRGGSTPSTFTVEHFLHCSSDRLLPQALPAVMRPECRVKSDNIRVLGAGLSGQMRSAESAQSAKWMSSQFSPGAMSPSV